MRAMILAAGVGSRLGPLTTETPKPLLPVGGRPVLDRTIEQCRIAGITEVVINVHHAAEKIRERYRDGASWGVHVRYSVEETLLGTCGALLRARELLGDRFLVIYGDNVFGFPFDRLIAFDAASTTWATLGVYARRDVARSGLVQVDEHDRVVRFIEKPRQAPTGIHLIFAGIGVFSSRALDVSPRQIPADIGRDLIPAMIDAGGRVAAFRLLPGQLFWIDTPSDYRDTDRAFGAGRLA